MSGFAIMKKQYAYLSSFVAGQGILVSRIFKYFSINFKQSLVAFLFACLCCWCCLFFPGEIVFSSILKIKKNFFERHSILREKKSQLVSNFELTRTLTIYEEHGIMPIYHDG